MSDKKRGNFIKGAVILSAAGFIARVMGFVYRVVLIRIIGSEGIGLYQMAYPIYTILLVISRSGIPVALAKLISDRVAKDYRKEAFKIFKVARYMSLGIGLLFSLLMAALAGPIINILNLNPKAYYSILAISPAIFFVSIMAAYRGFFQGLQNMIPTAVSQIVEQFVRMFTMIGLAYFLVQYGLEFAAAGASFGAVTGALAGLFILIYIYYKRRNETWDFVKVGSLNTNSSISIMKEIAALGLPVTLGALVQPLMNLVDLIFVPARLQVAGFTVEQATSLYGEFWGAAMPLVKFPTIITISLAASLVPSISEAFALKKDKLIKRRTSTAIRLTILIGLPSSVGLFALAAPLTGVIFNEPGAAIPLYIVSWGVLFITLQQTSSAILQGLSKPSIPARNLLIGAVANGVINYTLTALPQFGIRGAALGTLIGFAVAAGLNLFYVKRFTGFEFKFKELLLKPVAAVLVMAIIVNRGLPVMDYFIGLFFPENSYSIGTFLIVIFAALQYSICLVLFNEIRYGDLILIPKFGRKIADTLFEWGLVNKKNE